LRSADGSSAFRTNRLETVIPGDTTSWTEVDFVFDSTALAGFDSTDLRDVWFYLDRGTDNFAGNEFVFDYFTIGAAPDSSTFSTCPEDSTVDPPIEGIAYAIHYDSGADPLFSGSSADVLTQTIDSACSQLFLTVTAPDTAPWNGTSPIIVNPQDDMGSDITDLSGSMSFHLRVRSQDSVELALLLRAGDGSSAFRTDRISQLIPGDTMSWTEVTFTFDSAALGGFDSTDLRDTWLYLDYGTDNFAGNAFWVDYFAIGPKPDPSTHSDCSLLPPFEFPWVIHWNDASADTLGGSESFKYTQIIDTVCSQLAVSVTEPIFDPHEPFKPIVVNPKDELGNDLVDLSGNVRMYVRARSLEAVELSALLRSGGGSAGERTEIVRQMVPAGLDVWTELVYDFTGSNLVGFDSTDLRDFFLYLDRDIANFAGNEFYFDYLSIGVAPDEADDSDCVEAVSVADDLYTQLSVYPNPLPSGQLLQLELATASPKGMHVKLLNMNGQLLAELPDAFARSQTRTEWQLPQLVPGMYVIQLESEAGTQYQKLLIQ
ncbi:MAG: T9SS type A sorting domain-containing protein, partial [Bacteroidota bacterium]